jgi:hypothetical protein
VQLEVLVLDEHFVSGHESRAVKAQQGFGLYRLRKKSVNSDYFGFPSTTTAVEGNRKKFRYTAFFRSLFSPKDGAAVAYY